MKKTKKIKPIFTDILLVNASLILAAYVLTIAIY